MALVIGSVPTGFNTDVKNTVLIPLPPQNGGAIGWGGVYLSFGSDFQDSKLRVAVYNAGSNSWRWEIIDVPQNGGRVSYSIQDGDSKVSVGRVPVDEDDLGDNPVGWMVEAVLKA